MVQAHLPEPADVIANPKGKRNSWFVVGWIIISLVFAVGCWVRLKIATGELFWLDELHTGWTVGGSFEQMLARSAQGNQAPLFFGLEWSLVQWRGTSELNLRIVSLVAGALTMLLAARYVWLYTNSIAAAAITLTLIALDDNFIWYSTEARPYALLHLASIIQAGCFYRVIKHWQRMHWQPIDLKEPLVAFNHRFGIAWLLLSSWLVVYTHYTGVFLLATEGLFLLMLLFGWSLSRGINKNRLEQIFLTLVLFFAGCLPLLWQMTQAFGKPADWSSIASMTDFLVEQKINGIGWFGIPLVVVLLSSGVELLFRHSSANVGRANRWRQVRWLVWVVIWFAGPLVFIVMLQFFANIPLGLSRYMSVALIAGPIFAGGVVGICSARGRWIAIPIIVLASMFLHVQNDVFLPVQKNSLLVETIRTGRLPLLRTENWQSAIKAINENSTKAKWPLFLFGAVIEDANALSDSDADFQAYLQFPVRSIYELDSTQRVVFAGPTMSQQHFDERYLNDVVAGDGAWILVRHEAEISIEIVNQLVNMLQQRLKNSDATIEINWFGNRDNLVQLISIDIQK